MSIFPPIFIHQSAEILTMYVVEVEGVVEVGV
jgi:hypothetical protein